MRKNNSRKYGMAVVVCATVMMMSLWCLAWDKMIPGLILCALATLVACVWIVCEARVDRAAAPLNLPEAPVRRVYKPPEKERK